MKFVVATARIAALWVDVPDCGVHSGLPADWETRHGRPTAVGPLVVLV